MSFNDLTCFYLKASIKLIREGKREEAFTLLLYLLKVERGHLPSLEEMEQAGDLLTLSQREHGKED